MIPVMEGEPAGEALRALRTGCTTELAVSGGILCDPHRGTAACPASEGLEQRIRRECDVGGGRFAGNCLAFSSIKIAATLSTRFSMGAFLSHCICRAGQLFGIAELELSTGPLACTDAVVADVMVESETAERQPDQQGPPLKAARECTEAVDPRLTETLLASQTAVLNGYCTLVHRGLLPCGLNVDPTAFYDGNPLCHAIQDPTGALTAALFIVRRNCANLRASNPQNALGNLGVATRRVLGAILCVTHKMTAHAACVSYRAYAQHCVEVMQSPLDVPSHEVDWKREIQAMKHAEKAVLSEPLLSLTTENPMGEVEHLLDHFQRKRGLSFDDVALCRGMAFFFVGSLLFQRDVAMVNSLLERSGAHTIAAGCLIGAFSCFASARLREPGTDSPYTAHAAALAKGGAHVRSAAAAVLAAAASPEANALRRGPYATVYTRERDTVAHPIQLMLQPSNLARAIVRACESGWSSERKN